LGGFVDIRSAGVSRDERRDRFERELEKLKSYSLAAVVVEASMLDVSRQYVLVPDEPPRGPTELFPFQVRYRVSFVWAGSPEGGEYSTIGYR
jgi:hypothetical protein